MDGFHDPLIVEMMSGRKWKVVKEFTFHAANDDIISVPAGFITDLASIPRVLWNILPPNGKYGKASVVHDYLYVEAIGNKKYADNIFLEAMELLGVGYFKRYSMYWAVRAFGKGSYK